MTTFHPDLSQAKRFLDLLDPAGVFTFQTFADKKMNSHHLATQGARPPALARVLHGTLEEHAYTLALLNADGAGIFVMINEGDGKAHPGKKTCRTNDNVVRIRSVFVDLDGSPLTPILDAPLQPQIIVESSTGKWHAYWLTADTKLGEFKQLQQSLAHKYAGDPAVCDLARVMRLPGFYHQKAEPFMTRLVKPE